MLRNNHNIIAPESLGTGLAVLCDCILHQMCVSLASVTELTIARTSPTLSDENCDVATTQSKG